METGTVYADVLALINFSMDFAALKITSSVLRLRPKLRKTVSGAAAGAFYSFAVLFSGLGGFWQIPADAAAAMLICLIVYGVRDRFRWLLASAVFFTVGFIMGGVMTALYSRFGGYGEYLSDGGSAVLAEGAVDGAAFVALCVASVAIASATGRVIAFARRKKGCTLDVFCCGKKARLYCVCDSGNFAREPVSGSPVIFLCESSAVFLPDGVLRYMKSGDAEGCENKNALCAVPVSTVDGGSLKFAVRCESVKGERGEEYCAVLALSTSVPPGADGIAPAVMPEARKKDMQSRRRDI